jgi:hypothetical protein
MLVTVRGDIVYSAAVRWRSHVISCTIQQHQLTA